MRVIALTGVPGTGKTTIASHLDDVEVVDANDLARQVDALEGQDEQRGVAVVDEARLAERAREALPDGPVVVEGHLAHHCDPDIVILLRCHPDELERRLQERGWSRAKVDENVMAETLDALVPEIHVEPAREVDTTDVEPAALADRIKGLFTGDPLNQDWLQPLGTADWTPTLVGEDDG